MECTQSSPTYSNSYVARVLPRITTGTTQSYINTAALVAAYASEADPLTLAFQYEKPNVLPPNPTANDIREVLYKANVQRLEIKIASGAIIAESANFAAVACWSPPGSSQPFTPSIAQEILASGRKLFAEGFLRAEAVKEKYLYPLNGNNYYHLSLMARDPRVPYVPGAVRAVVDPLVAKARAEKIPLWLEAGDVRARDVYAHFGFQVVEPVMIGGSEVWCMVMLPEGFSLPVYR